MYRTTELERLQLAASILAGRAEQNFGPFGIQYLQRTAEELVNLAEEIEKVLDKRNDEILEKNQKSGRSDFEVL